MIALLLVLLSFAALVVCNDVPIQHRIALLPDGMTVSWSTQGKSTIKPQVRYGTDPTHLDQHENGLSQHYESSTTYFHHVELHGLATNTRYYWQVMTSSNDTKSPVHAFYTQPDVSKEAGTFNVAIYGDMGIDNSDNTLTLLRELADKRQVDLFWHVGDLSYADDHARTDLTYEQIMEGWMNNMTNHIWTETPYMFTPGNHEHAGGKNTTESQKNFTSYRTRFHMPARPNAVAGSDNMFYSFDYGLMHFISIDTEAAYPNSPEGNDTGPFGDQAAWLRADLAAAVANQDRVPWIVIGGHRPFFTSGGHLTALTDFFLPIFAEYEEHIAAIFVGHIHWYERMYALRSNGSVCSTDYQKPNCPVYIVTGAPGNIEGLSNCNKPKRKKFTAKLVCNFGIGVLHVEDATTMRWDFIESDTRKVTDSITITKDNSAKRIDSDVRVPQLELYSEK
jgi:hypothetical protein